MPRKVRISLGINATVSFFMKMLFFVQGLLVFETRSLVARGNGFVYVLFTVKKQSRKGKRSLRDKGLSVNPYMTTVTLWWLVSLRNTIYRH